MTEILVPTLGESVTTATVARWLKKVGESVAADEPLVELETDKVTVEVNAPSAGTIESIAADEGAEVEVGGLLGSLGAGSGAAAAAPAAKPAAPAAAPAAAAPAAPKVEAPRPVTGPVSRPGGADHAPLPAAAKMMADNGVSAGQIGQGSAKDGRIAKGDVLDFLAVRVVLHVTQQHLADGAAQVHLEDGGVEGFLLQGVPQRVVIELDQLRLALATVDDARRLAGVAETAARTRALLGALESDEFHTDS